MALFGRCYKSVKERALGIATGFIHLVGFVTRHNGLFTAEPNIVISDYKYQQRLICRKNNLGSRLAFNRAAVSG